MRFENGRGKAFECSFDEEYILCTILAALHIVFELCKRELRDKKLTECPLLVLASKETQIYSSSSVNDLGGICALA